MIVACVRTGQKYGTNYVMRLQAAVKRHLPIAHRFVCFTDNPKDLGNWCETIETRKGLHGWWGKMQLFEPTWRAGEKVLYLDLDSVLLKGITPLATVKTERWATAANFTVIHQQRACITGGSRPAWPCKYGNAFIVIGPYLNGAIWDRYLADKQGIEQRAGIYGDQMALEALDPEADLLQPQLPEGFFLGYRDLHNHPNGPPPGAAIVVFAGKNKPHNTDCEWARKAWLKN